MVVFLMSFGGLKFGLNKIRQTNYCWNYGFWIRSTFVTWCGVYKSPLELWFPGPVYMMLALQVFVGILVSITGHFFVTNGCIVDVVCEVMLTPP